MRQLLFNLLLKQMHITDAEKRTGVFCVGPHPALCTRGKISWIYTLRKGKNDFLILTNTVYACFYLFIFNYSCNPKKQERMRQVNILLSLICDLFSSLLYVLKSVFIIKYI